LPANDETNPTDRHIPARRDVSSCLNKDCPSRLDCYRYRKEVNFWQTFTGYVVPEGADRCASFVEILESDWVDGPVPVE
jgi:hypothetical protein